MVIWCSGSLPQTSASLSIKFWMPSCGLCHIKTLETELLERFRGRFPMGAEQLLDLRNLRGGRRRGRRGDMSGSSREATKQRQIHCSHERIACCRNIYRDWRFYSKVSVQVQVHKKTAAS